MPEERPRKSSRWFSCLVKGPLGCCAFLLGAFLVFVLFFPSAAGRLGDRGLERWFERHFEGSLELGEVWLGSVYNQQRIESLSVRDPGGEEVLRGSLRAPSLAVLFAPDSGGEIELTLASVHLVEHPDGSTNLERAFRSRGASGIGDVALEFPRPVALVVRIDKLRWSDARGRGGLLSDLVWRGTLQLSGRNTAVVLEGGAEASLAKALSLALDYQSPRNFGGDAWEGRFRLTARELPLGLVRHVAASVVPTALCEGDELDELVVARAAGRGTWSLFDEGLRLEASGVLEEGVLRGEPGVPARLSVPLGSAQGEFLLARTVPFLVPTVLSGQGPVEFQLEEFTLPRDGRWEALAGRLRFRLTAGTFGFDPVALQALGGGLDLAALDLAATLPIAGGKVDLTGLAVPLERGMLLYAGQSELASGVLDVSFARELDGVREALGGWRGTVGKLAPAPPGPEEPRVPGIPRKPE